MHELSLAMALIEELERAAKREGATQVTAVSVVIGALSGVERDPFEFCFPLAAEGSCVEGATLEIEEVPLTVLCRACGAKTEARLPDLSCGKCGDFGVDVIDGREFRVRSMEVI